MPAAGFFSPLDAHAPSGLLVSRLTKEEPNELHLQTAFFFFSSIHLYSAFTDLKQLRSSPVSWPPRQMLHKISILIEDETKVLYAMGEVFLHCDLSVLPFIFRCECYSFWLHHCKVQASCLNPVGYCPEVWSIHLSRFMGEAAPASTRVSFA